MAPPAPRLRILRDPGFERLRSFLQFAMVGCSGLAVDLSTYFLLLKWLPVPLAGGLAIWIAMTSNFILNRRLTFSYARHESAWRQYVQFCASCLLGGAVNWSARVGLRYLHPLFAEYPIAAVIVGVAGGTVFNYLLCRHVVFRTTPEAAPQDPEKAAPPRARAA